MRMKTLSVAKKISEEIKAMPPDKSCYTPITLDNIFDNCSETLKMLLCHITPKFENTLPSAMIDSIVTSTVTGNFTPLQLSLGLLIHEKSKINELYKYHVTSTYDETRRFKIDCVYFHPYCCMRLYHILKLQFRYFKYC